MKVRMRSFEIACAIFASKDAKQDEVFSLFRRAIGIPLVPSKKKASVRILETFGGDFVYLPILSDGQPMYLVVGGRQFKWPILPLVPHRGGFMTATARHLVELGQSSYVTVSGDPIEKRGKYVRTAHRVVYADRVHNELVVDVLKRPRR